MGEVEPGVVVRLKSGGPNMLVVDVFEHTARCIRVEDRDVVRQDFPLVDLWALTAGYERMAEVAHDFWGVVANVSEGDWKKQPKEWREAAERTRDAYHKALSEYVNGMKRE